ncbi:MAG: two-component system sensor histidine kinase RppB [Phormidesmis sp.]
MAKQSLFRSSRLRLSLWYAGVMAVILSLSGLGAYRALIQSNWAALEREIESSAGTLHDSVEPLLPSNTAPVTLLQKIFPELCLVGRPCDRTPTLIQRHTLGVSDRTTYYIRLFNYKETLLGFSPNQPSELPATLVKTPWQTFESKDGNRYHQFTILLHGGETSSSEANWGYLQIGRSLAEFDAENARIQNILLIGFPLMLAIIAASSWWLSGLAIRPIYVSYQQQQQFTANTAHELRTPIASLLATIEALRKVPPTSPEDANGLLSQIEKQGHRISRLFNDLLNLAYIEQTPVLPLQRCCLNDIVIDLIEEFSELADGTDIQLSSYIPERSINVMGNEPQLYRLISNLMANAIQYTPKGGTVTVSLERRDRTAYLHVSDTGIGIESGEQKRIFDRFYRVNRDRSRQTGGNGLGLAIAQAIAQAHNGRLTIESQPSKGSTFTLQIATLAFESS